MTTIPDDMVERVGRALAAAADDEFEPNRDFWGRYSRAAIESIQPYILPYILGADGPFVRDSDHCAAILAAEKRGEERERERWEHVETVLFEIEQWCRAYPVKVFPEPDFTRAAELLAAGGMSLDAISASNMRHVLTSIEDNIAAIRQG